MELKHWRLSEGADRLRFMTNAELFRSLHVPGTPLVLVNAWDAASARIAEAAGSTAVATTSAGVAWSLGAPDGDVLDRDQAVELIKRIVKAVSVPVTADIEGGFGTTPAEVGETITAVIAAGAVGVNIEDGDRDAQTTAARLAAARAAADASGVPLFINARIDTYLRGFGGIAETLDRAAAYIAAGADGIFVPGVADPALIKELAASINAPLNILAGPGSPSIPDLGALGVARVSLGSSVAQAAYSIAQEAAKEALTSGTYESLNRSLDYGAINSLLR